MPAATLLIDEPHPGVRVLTLNRPKKRNAIDRRLFSDLIDALKELSDAPVRAAILTGRGSAFCSGVDLGDVGDRELLETALALAQRIAQVPPGQVQRIMKIYDDGEGLSRAKRLELARRSLLETLTGGS